MIAAFPPASRRTRPAFAFGVALGLLAPVALFGAFALWPRDSSPARIATADRVDLGAQRQGFRTFEAAVARAVEDGGFVVTQGMQPGVSDIAEGAFDDATLVGMARGWRDSMERVRKEFADLEVAPFLADTAGRFEEALAAYVSVAEELLAAAKADDAERAALIEAVPEVGRTADRLWERAQAALEGHRARLGLVPAATPST